MFNTHLNSKEKFQFSFLIGFTHKILFYSRMQKNKDTLRSNNGTP
ncbi:hypothetical protein HPHPP26_1279 [Helicobacter pylori Hp P-26]|nr:hypothetical protein HPHPP26_1279 [Helicobacter pylori Hp P-26]EMG83513.1 hypothetical protein HMPREF1394_00462 [Helicobacter pylori GAM105Ai]